MQWQPIENAPRDGTRILATIHRDLFPRVRPSREDLEVWNGIQIVIRHGGFYGSNKDGDLGWNVVGPLGHGGFPDDWFAGWMPLPEPPNA